MKVSKEIETDPRAASALRILVEYWELPLDKHSAISDAVRKLRGLTIIEDNAEEWIYSIIEALRYFAREEPSAIDWGIDVFHAPFACLFLAQL